MPLASEENTPLQGEHFPGSPGLSGSAGSDGPAVSRWQVFGPIVAALLVVGGGFAWSLQPPPTVAGLKAGRAPLRARPPPPARGGPRRGAGTLPAPAHRHPNVPRQ